MKSSSVYFVCMVSSGVLSCVLVAEYTGICFALQGWFMVSVRESVSEP